MLLLLPSFHSASDYENTVASVFRGITEETEAPLHADFSGCHVIRSIAFESVKSPPQQNNIRVYLEKMLYVDVHVSDSPLAAMHFCCLLVLPPSFLSISQGLFSLPLLNGQ